MNDWTKIALVSAPVVALAVLVKFGAMPPPPAPSTPPPATATTPRPAAKPEPAATVDAQGELAAAIRSKGFNCASVWNVGDRGEDAFGKVYRVRCGPVSGVSTMPGDAPQFKVTIHSSGRARVQPWD